MKKVAVIILNWNGAELLRRYLPTVIAGTDDAIGCHHSQLERR